MRIGSEFVSLTTPSLIGGVVVRAAWLSQKGVDSGKAFWIAHFEVLLDVYVGSIFALAAAVYAFLKGATLIGTTISLIVGFQLIFYSCHFSDTCFARTAFIPEETVQTRRVFCGRHESKNSGGKN